MYSTCLFCHSPLGSNEAIESFPVGRRLAFDGDKGRLWVVCRRCSRWNLTPAEERWEAIEQCERAFSSTRLRVSTDNVGLARLSEGLELVRIGKPQRPEFAAWRYGDQFGRRRRRFLVYSGIGAVTAVAGVISGPAAGFVIGGIASGAMAVNAAGMLVNLVGVTRVRGRIAVPGESHPAIVRVATMKKIRILNDGDRWRLRMPMDGAILTGPASRKVVTLEGDAALRATATILTVVNSAGAKADLLRDAIDIVAETPDASRLFLRATSGSWEVDPKENYWKYRDFPKPKVEPGETAITELPAEMSLALEMATNEDIERRAMEGELAMLELDWKQAEEIAAIADNLYLEKPGDISARSDV